MSDVECVLLKHSTLIVFGSNTHPCITSFLETLGDGSCRVF